MIARISSFARRIARLRHPRLATLEEWIEHHQERVRQDVEEIVEHLPEEGTLLDIGANVGLFTEAVLARRPNLHAILVEPVERYARLCAERFAHNPNVTVHHIGISDREQELTIYYTPGNYGGNSVVEELMFDSRENTLVLPGTDLGVGTIQCIAFEEFARRAGIERLDFVKTDTEGYDYAVLTAMLPFLERSGQRPVILSELLMESFHPYGREQRAARRELERIGYHPIEIEAATERVADYLFLPRG